MLTKVLIEPDGKSFFKVLIQPIWRSEWVGNIGVCDKISVLHIDGGIKIYLTIYSRWQIGWQHGVWRQ